MGGGAVLLLGLLACSLGGCRAEPETDVLLCATVNEPLARPIVAAYERSVDYHTGVIGDFDLEASEIVRAPGRVVPEDGQPRCDVIWNEGILATVRLQQRGRLKPRRWPSAAGWPPGMIASDGSWCGVAATARVLIVNTEMLSEREDWPTSVRDLADPEWSDRCAMASPLSGTTATHVAVLKAVQGTEATLEFLEAVAANAAILPDNAAVAKAVAEGEYAWGLTDSDQAVIAQDRRWPVEVTFPDQQPDQPGALRIPSTVAVLAGAPHPVAAGQLADYLVSAETEDRLAMGPRSQLPISRQSEYRPRVLPRQPVRWMDVDFEAAAEGWPAWIETLAARLSAEVD